RYLYGSRQAWNLGAVTRVSEEALAWIWDTTDFLSVKSLLARVGLDPRQLYDALEEAGFGAVDWERRLTHGERKRLRSVFGDNRVKTLIADHAASQRQVVIDYFRQEGVLDQIPWGMFDLG